LAIARQIAADLSQPTLQWLATWIQVGPALLRGRLDEAERQIDEALELGQATGQPDADVMSVSQRFLVRLEQERLAEVEDAVSTVCDRYPGLPGFGLFLARIYWETGREEEARRIFERFAASSFDLPRDPTWLMFMMAAADLAADLNDVNSCRLVDQLLAPYPQVFSVAGGVTHGCVAYYLGRLTTALGRLDDAENHLRYAAGVYRRIDAPAWAGRTHVALARILLARRGRPDIDRARALLTEQLATARALGLANVERRPAALLQESG
jgi:tetratricopeptide (TPR) repeat protein